MNIQTLVENKDTLNYPEICTTLIQIFGVDAKINWESVLPAQQQQSYFGGETLRLIADHPVLKNQKDIRPISLKKGETSQMLFMYVCLKDTGLAKKNIQEVSKKFISGGEANRYIIWFFGNPENTQLKVVLSAKEGKRVVLKTLPFGVNQPYYKTYNFILNEVNTQGNQLFVEPTDLWKALWKAFDISIINRKFYEEIKQVFDDLIKKELPKGTTLFKTEEAKAQFSIRLIGRIIFCWFLKRKGIIQEDALSAHAVQENNGTYYHELLETLFFDVFNTPKDERKKGLPKSIAHYHFLNGGLFEAQENDFKDNFALTISNDWFYRFFAKTLEKYNFTVDENSSSNAEIAIDPEMLGRIFENLLAEQNPETGESARKSTGSFYTPREIVDYMVEQSIIEYLKTTLKGEEHFIVEEPLKMDLFGFVPNQQLTLPKVIENDLPLGWEEMIEDFVHTQVLPMGLQKHEKKINEALTNVKVLDPACGSGAFPMGVLQKIVALKQPLNPKTAAYKLKLDTIQNSIYGIDIQPMAVELSRLRCWLSLVVDEEANNIKALPNLDFKFVCADSLVDVPENEYVRIQSQKSLEAFGRATSQYFNPDFKKKKELQKEIKKCLTEITQWHKVAIEQIIKKIGQEAQSATEAAKKKRQADLANYSQQYDTWNSYKNIFENKKVGFFNVEYFFPAAKEGFDIVIGNPPYVSMQRIKPEDKISLQKVNYDTFENTGDIYALFYERGCNLLEKGGILSYITSRQWMHAGYGKSLRRFFAQKTNPLILIDFGQTKIFEGATVFVNILLLSRNPNQKELQACLIENEDKWENNLTDTVRENKKPISHVDENTWKIDDTKAINDVIKSKGKSLAEYEAEGFVLINRGITTGFNDAFHIQAEKKDELISKDPKNAEIIKPLLRGKDIKRYAYEFADWYMLFIPWHFPLHNDNSITKCSQIAEDAFQKNFLNVYQHLYNFKDELANRNQTETGIRYEWYALQRYGANFWREFDKPKIIWIEISDRANYTYDDKGMYLTNSAYFLTCNTDKFSLKYLLAILNSQLSDYYFSQFTAKIAGGRMRYTKQYVEHVIIPEIDKEAQQPFITLVDYVLFIKKMENAISNTISNNLITQYLEDIIDGMVLELYFEEEMKEKKVNIIGFVEKELQKCTSEDIIENIYQFYRSISHPDSEIRNRILLFPLASPHILKPILQA